MRPVGPDRGAPPPGRGPRGSVPGRRAGGGGTRLLPGGGGMTRPPAGTTRGPLGGVPGGGTGVPVGVAVVGRAAGGRLVTLDPRCDDTTRGAAGADGAGDTGAVVAAGAIGVSGAEGCGAEGCGATTGAGVTGAAATVASSAVFLDLAGAFTGLVVSASPVVDFAALVFFGFSGAGSRFRPFSSALRRTRSACASTMVDDAVVAPMPSELQRSTTSFEDMPSSLASSDTRTFLLLKPWRPRQ